MEITLLTYDEWKQECHDYAQELAHYWFEERFERALLILGVD